MNLKKTVLFLLILIVVGVGGYFLKSPCLIVESESEILMSFLVEPGNDFSLNFRHSVHKTPVIENIKIGQSGELIVSSTEYESYGVGMPFLESEGRLRIEGSRFILEDIKRPFKTISLRVGPEAQQKLQYQGQKYSLYQMVPPGGIVNLRIAPYYYIWLNKLGIDRR